jgi:hypothetical protein
MYLPGYEREMKEKKERVTNNNPWIFGLHATPWMGEKTARH